MRTLFSAEPEQSSRFALLARSPRRGAIIVVLMAAVLVLTPINSRSIALGLLFMLSLFCPSVVWYVYARLVAKSWRDAHVENLPLLVSLVAFGGAIGVLDRKISGVGALGPGLAFLFAMLMLIVGGVGLALFPRTRGGGVASLVGSVLVFGGAMAASAAYG